MMTIIKKIRPGDASLKTKWLTNVYQRYKACRDGVAAIEFAFVAPVMIAMYFGLAEISLAIAVDRRVSHSANVAGDLATQMTVITPAAMGEIMTAAMLVMDVPDSRRGSVNIEIASFAKEDDGSGTEVAVPRGLATYNGTYPTPYDATSLNDSILSAASGIVVARITYEYEPLKLQFLPNTITLSETFLLKPRSSIIVDIKDASDTFTAYNCEDESGKVDCT